MRSLMGTIRNLGLAVASVVTFTAVLPLAAADEKAAPVTVTTVEQGVVEQVVVLTGTVTAERRSSLSARTAGLVKMVKVDAGSRVKQGDVLLELDSALATLARERASEAVQEARATLEERRRLVAEGRHLTRSGGIPKTDMEARLAALRAQEAAVNQLEVDLREQTEIVDRHKLVAPFSGVISAKMTEVGEWVETGVPVLELVEVDAVRFDVQAPQERYAALTNDTPVTVRLDSAPDREYPARLRVKVPVKDPVARTFLVRLEVEAPAGVMAPGVSGVANFRIQGKANALTVARDAIVRLPDGSAVVWLVQEEPERGLVARARPVRIGGRMNATVEITTGVEKGQRVILRGNETLQDGQAIRILPDSTTEVGG